MPPVIVAAGIALGNIGIAVASAVGATGFFAVGASLYAPVALGAAVVAGAALVATKAINSLFAVDMPQVDSDASRQRTVKSTTEPFKTVYGETLVSGPITYIGMAGTDNADLYHVIALAGHEVTDIRDVHFDNKVITNAQINSENAAGGNVIAGDFGPKGSTASTICVINKHRGTATQAADSMMVSTFSDYTSSHQGKNVAYIAMKWTLNEDSAETWEKFAPADIKAIVKGRKVYDPRLDVAANNEPGANPANTAYIEYSTNPALCLADYLINSEFGLGVAADKVDWPAIVTAADGCDVSVTVPGGTQDRYTCNGVLFGTDSHRTNINKILSSMNGTLVYSNGKYILRAGIYEAPAQSLNEDDLIGAIGIKTSFERSDRFNTVKGVFVDPAQNHKSSEFPKVQLAAALSRDNALVLEKEMQFPMTNSSFGAQRLAHKLINKTSQQKVITFPANLGALRIIAGDRVNVSIEELSWSNKIFQCVGWTFADDGGVNLTLREDDQDAYDDPASNEYSTITASGDITDAFRGVPAPSGLSAVSGEAKVFLNWQNPGRPGDFGTVEVYASTVNDRSNSTALKKIGETDGTQFVHDSGNAFDPIAVGNVRYYWIRCKKNVGADADRTAVSDFSTGTTSGVSSTVLATAVNWSNVANPTIGVDLNADDTIKINLGDASAATSGNAVATSGIEEDVTITQGGIRMNQGGSIRGGQTSYNSGEGFFLGYDSSKYKLSVRTSTSEALTFDGSNLSVTGNITATSGTFTGTVNANAGAFTGDVSTSSKFVAGSGATSATMDGADANYKFYAGAAALGDSPFKIDANGGVTASRIVITRPNDPSAVIFDSAQDGLVGVGLSSLSAESDNAVAQVADELTSNTDYARLILSTTQTLTVKVLFPLNYLPFAISSAEDFPDSITLKLQKATITSGTPGTFSDVSGGTKTFTRRVYNGSEASNDNYYSVNDSGTGWYIRDRDGIDAQFNLSMSDASVYVAGDTAVRVQVSYVAGSGSTSANPSSSSKRTLYFNSATQYFTIDDSSIIRDQAPGSLLTGDVILSGSSGARTISWRDSDTYDENWSIEGLTGYGESGSGVLYFKFNNGSTSPIAFVDNGNVLIGGDFYSGAGAVTTSTASFGGGYGSTGTSISADGNISTDGSVIVGGDLTVNGTTTTVNTDNLTVKDNNITLNYSSGDSSSTANNAGITVQDAVNSTTDATLLWKTATDTFEFSHPIKAQSDLTLSSAGGDAGIYWKDSSASDATAWHLHADVTQLTTNLLLNYAGGGINFSFVNNGNFLAPGTIYADGAASNSLQWEAGYDYSQVGHLPLTGGTLTGAVTSTALTTTNSGITLQSGSTTKSAINVAAATNQGINGTAAGDQYNWTTGGKMLWSTNSGTTAHLVLDGSGSLGVGTNSPSSFVESSRLVVGSGTSGTNEMMFLYSGTNAFGAIGFADGTSGTSAYKGIIGYHHTSDELFFSTNGGGEASRNLTISSSGNATFSGSVSSTGFRFGNTSVGTEDDSEYLLSTGGQLIIRANDSAADDSYAYLILDSGNASGAASASAGVMTRTNGVERLRVGGDGTIKFFEDTGTTAKMFWSASDERLSLTGSDYQLKVQQGSNQPWYLRSPSDGSFRFHLNGTGDIATITGTHFQVNGTATADALTVDNITIDGNEIDVSSGDLTLDVAGDIVLDADGGDVLFKDNGTHFGSIFTTSTPGAMYIQSLISGQSLHFATVGGVGLTIGSNLASTFAGAATFNSTVTSTGLTVGNSNIGSNTSHLANLTINNNGYIGSASATTALQIATSGNATFSGSLDLAANTSFPTAGFTLHTNGFLYNKMGSNGFIFSAQNGTEAMRINGDATQLNIPNGSLMVGSTTAPVKFLDVGVSSNASAIDANIRLNTHYGTQNTARGGIQMFDGANVTGQIDTRYDGTKVDMHFGSLYNGGYNTTSRMVITGAGNVGIGHTSPSAPIDVRRADASGKIAEFHNNVGYGVDIGSSTSEAYISSGYNQSLLFKTDATSGQVERMRIMPDGAVVINPVGGDGQLYFGGTAGNLRMFLARSGLETLLWNASNGAMRFGTNNAERARLTNDGNLLVGRTSASFGSDTGLVLRPNNDSYIIANDSPSLTMRRNNSDGAIAQFYKDGTTIGSISTHSGKLRIDGANGNLQLGARGAALTNLDTNHFYPETHNSVDLGHSSSLAFRNLWLSGGVNVLGNSASLLTQLSLANASTDVASGSSIDFQTGSGPTTTSRITSAYSSANKTELIFSTYNSGLTESMRISDGNLLVGKTASNSFTTSGLEVFSNGAVNITGPTNGGVLYLNRKGTDGGALFLYKDNSLAGSLGVNGGDLYIENGVTGISFNNAYNAIIPTTTGGAVDDGNQDLGISTHRWRNLYLSGTAKVVNATILGTDTTDVASIGTSAQRVYIKPNGTEIIYNASGNSAGQHVWQSGNVERARLTSDGKFGLGLTNPSANIHIYSSGQAIARVEGANEYYSGLMIRNNHSSTQSQWHVAAAGGTSGWGAANGNFIIRDDTTNSTGIEIERGAGGSTGALYIDSSGNVGISVTPSAFVLPDGSSGALQLQSGGMVSAYNGVTHLSQNWYFNSGEKYIANGSASRLVMSGADYIWQSAGNNTSGAGAALTWSESMRLSGGNLLVGTASAVSGSASGVQVLPAGFIRTGRGATTGETHLEFYNPNGRVGLITTAGTTTAYNTSSDQRLKENIADADDAGSKVDAIQVRKFDWKADGSHQDYGMIAQELIEVAPEAVSQGETEEDMMGVDYSKLVPMLIKEIQQLRKRVKDLEEE